MTEGYGAAAQQYWAAGWKGILPLPSGKKTPPPPGTTGYQGYFPGWPDIQAWTEIYPEGNLGLRLPNTVVGIDVDAYGDKTGAATLTEAERRWGALPSTVRSTARLDGVSGIRLYRVPPGTELETVVGFPELELSGIEVVQFFHRYCVSWPSIHPAGGQYRWLDQEGRVTSALPRPNTVPLLPDGWITGLRRRAAAEITASGDAAAVVKSLPSGMMSPRVQQELNGALADLATSTGSRHDVTLKRVLKLFRLAEQGGESGIKEALDRLGEAFVKAVTKDGSRDVAGAAEEFQRMVIGQRGHDLIASTPSELSMEQLAGKSPHEAVKAILIENIARQQQEPLPEDPMDEADAFLFDEKPTTAPIESNPVDDFLFSDEPEEQGVTESRTSWGPVDLDAILSGDFEPEEATQLQRDDGKWMFYPGRVNALVGPPESGKSFVAMHACAQSMSRGERVVYIDFEDSAQSVVGRFLALGVPAGVLRERLTYILPDLPLWQEEGAQQELFGLLQSTRPEIITVDGVNAAMTLLGLALDKNTDATQFHQLLLKPLTATGAAVVTIDHVTKAREGRGGFAIGAQAKKAMTDGAMIGVEAVEPFGRGRLGKLELTILKDKPGGVRAFAEKRKNDHYIGSVTVDARQEGRIEMIVFHETGLTEDEERDAKEKARAAEVNRDKVKISNYLAERPDGARKGTLEEDMRDQCGSRDRAVHALSELEKTGFVKIETVRAKGSPKVCTLLRPYAAPTPEDDADAFLMA